MFNARPQAAPTIRLTISRLDAIDALVADRRAPAGGESAVILLTPPLRPY